MLELIEEYVGPDGALRFQVTRDPASGETILGFAGYCWHTHPELLAAGYGLPEPEAVRKSIDDLLADRLVIGIFRQHGEVSDVAIEDDPGHGYEWMEPWESIEYRYWSGKTWEGERPVP
ncbi:hypothetical protein [Paludisphaera soli]|uniref:hypothetical protein n=1 Tax=Paludisphaera soli TaxID=2712865 RepID=UPI0013ED62C9|nr:hypothetical protein [Paludisphaera soli]